MSVGVTGGGPPRVKLPTAVLHIHAEPNVTTMKEEAVVYTCKVVGHAPHQPTSSLLKFGPVTLACGRAGGRLSCALEDVQQHPWPPPSRCPYPTYTHPPNHEK